jgi:hypothetical protein
VSRNVKTERRGLPRPSQESILGQFRMACVIYNFQMIRTIISHFNKVENLLVRSGMAIAIRDSPNLSLKIISMSEYIEQFVDFYSYRQSRIFVFLEQHQNENFSISRSRIVRKHRLGCCMQALPKLLEAHVILPSIDVVESRRCGIRGAAKVAL